MAHHRHVVRVGVVRPRWEVEAGITRRFELVAAAVVGVVGSMLGAGSSAAAPPAGPPQPRRRAADLT